MRLLGREQSQRLGQEVPDERFLRAFHFGDGSERQDAGLIQDENAVGDFERAGHVVGNDHARDLELAGELENQVVDCVGRDRIETRRGLIKEKIARPGRERARERNAFLHSVGNFGRHTFKTSAPKLTSVSFSSTSLANLSSVSGLGRERMYCGVLKPKDDVLINESESKKRRDVEIPSRICGGRRPSRFRRAG